MLTRRQFSMATGAALATVTDNAVAALTSHSGGSSTAGRLEDGRIAAAATDTAGGLAVAGNHAGAAEVALHPTDTDNYIHNLQLDPPRIWVVLRPVPEAPRCRPSWST